MPATSAAYRFVVPDTRNKAMATVIRTRHKVFAHVRYRDIEVDPSTLRLETTSWAWVMLLQRSRESANSPEHRHGVEVVLSTLEGMRQDEAWREFCHLPTNQLTPEIVRDQFEALEQHLVNVDVSDVRRRAMSQLTRKWIVTSLIKARVPKIHRVFSLFTSRLSVPHPKPRALISDFVQVDENGRKRPPLGALPHSNVVGLQRDFQERLRLDLAAVSAACTHELEAQRNLREHFARAESRPVAPEFINEIDALSRGKTARHPQHFRSADIADLERSYISVLRRDFERASIFGPTTRDLPRCDELIQRVRPEARLGFSFRKLLMASDFGTRTTVTSAAMLLQIHTGWNFSSVLELSADCIKRSGGLVEIQSFKSRTNDFTPIVLLTSKDVDALQALDFLERRLSCMKAYGWVSTKESNLWLNPHEAYHARSDVFTGWGSALSILQAKHCLPKFSFEQLRVQVLAVVAATRGGLEAARHTAGHANISTTAHYLDQLVLRRLNSAVNLEFQARLERSIEFRMSPGSKGPTDEAEDLLYAVGDGSSCINPLAPPDPSQMDGGICDAKGCHAGGGCLNRRISIDSDRVEEIVLTSNFYESNWRRLLLENEEEFRELHLPAFLFNIAIQGIVERSSYRHVLHKVKERVHADFAG